MNELQLIGIIGMLVFYMFAFYFIINIFNKKKDERENIALLKAIKSAIVIMFFGLWFLIIFYMGYEKWTVPSGWILLVLAAGMLTIIISYKINLSEKALIRDFLDGKSKDQKRKILNHITEALAFLALIFILLMLWTRIKYPQAKETNLYYLGFFICVFLEMYISSKIPKKKQSDEEIIKNAKIKRMMVIITSAFLFISIGAGAAAFFIAHK